MQPNPFALALWWLAVQQQYDRAQESPVLRWHLGGREFLVRAADLDEVVKILETLAPPGRDGPFPSPGTPPQGN